MPETEFIKRNESHSVDKPARESTKFIGSVHVLQRPAHGPPSTPSKTLSGSLSEVIQTYAVEVNLVMQAVESYSLVQRFEGRLTWRL